MDGSAKTPGDRFGRYLVYGRIASGGMAAVHLARLPGPAGFSRLVALKRLHQHYARDQKFVAMLLDEARLVALVRHPNVVPTLEVLVEGDEVALVMDYVEGVSLDALVAITNERGGSIPVDVAVSIMIQGLHGLHAAHETLDARGRCLGIVHRDVSPHNILVGTDGVARILDFGVATAADRLQRTETGEIKGKLPYMSPEQLSETALDRRTDIFSAGVVLWELLTGRKLFASSSAAGTMGNVLGRAIPLPSEAGCPSTALDRIVLRALGRDPDTRFGTAEELALALEEAIAPARPRDVGRWVQNLAGDLLVRRAAMVREAGNAEDAAAGRDDRSPTTGPPLVLSAPLTPGQGFVVARQRSSPDDERRDDSLISSSFTAMPRATVGRPVVTVLAVAMLFVGIALGSLRARSRAAEQEPAATASGPVAPIVVADAGAPSVLPAPLADTADASPPGPKARPALRQPSKPPTPSQPSSTDRYGE